MSLRSTMILIGIVVLPLAIAGWLVGRTVSSEQEIAQQRLRRLAVLELEKVNIDLAAVFADLREAALAELASLSPSWPVEQRRQWTRDSLLVAQLYVVDAQGRVNHPPIADPGALTASERESLARTSSVWDGGTLMAEVAAAGELSSPATRDGGWFTWYWDTGIRWILWQRSADWIQAIELERVRVLSEIINALPDTALGSAELASGSVRLTNAANQTVYQWGPVEPGDGEYVLARIPAIDPLSSWSLEYHTATLTGPAASHLGMVGGWLAVIVAVSALAINLHREHSRSLREAEQRVTFVNQVSHELKTPLTNIRMYAELMSGDGMEPDDPHRRHLGVIVSESRRLSRLINNVLTLGAQQKLPIELHRRPIVLDEIVDNVMHSFLPALEDREIEIDRRLDAGRLIQADPDRLEQIIGNLVGNVEKYAHAGHYLGIKTRIDGGSAELWVEDKGTGIPDAAARHVFDPFYRVEDSLTEGVSGTGIGLSIARDLARLHGGDLTYERTSTGSRFRLRLPIGSELV